MRACLVCGELSTTRCGKCKAVYYCGPECQKKHWESHREMCAVAADPEAWKGLIGNSDVLDYMQAQGLCKLYVDALRSTAAYRGFCVAMQTVGGQVAAKLPKERDDELTQAWIMAIGERPAERELLTVPVCARAMCPGNKLPVAAARTACRLVELAPVAEARQFLVIACNVHGAADLYPALDGPAALLLAGDSVCARVLMDLLPPESEARARCAETVAKGMEAGFSC